MRRHAAAATTFISLALSSPSNAFSASKFSATRAGILHPTVPDTVLERRPEEERGTGPTTTKAGGDLIEHYSESLGLSPFERVALTCYGNLQVVFSSFHNKAIDVAVDLFEMVPADGGRSAPAAPVSEWDRVVRMTISGELFCEATCKVRVYDEEMHRTMTDQDVGIGQLLRWKGLQPVFGLHEAGRLGHGGLWRFYSMDCPGMVEFDILEEFPEDAFDLASLE